MLTMDCDRTDHVGISLVIAAILVSTLCYVFVLMHAGVVIAE